jgi:hypothetical protein
MLVTGNAEKADNILYSKPLLDITMRHDSINTRRDIY